MFPPGFHVRCAGQRAAIGVSVEDGYGPAAPRAGHRNINTGGSAHGGRAPGIPSVALTNGVTPLASRHQHVPVIRAPLGGCQQICNLCFPLQRAGPLLHTQLPGTMVGIRRSRAPFLRLLMKSLPSTPRVWRKSSPPVYMRAPHSRRTRRCSSRGGCPPRQRHTPTAPGCPR